jgi:hypothetical protein
VDWYFGYAGDWGDYYAFPDGWRFWNARTGQRVWAVGLGYKNLEYGLGHVLRLRVAWYSTNGQLVRESPPMWLTVVRGL